MTGEGNRTSYVRQNGRTYAYVYRSGIDGPRTEYLGKVDESSGDVMIPRRRLPAPRRKEGAVMSMELGSVLILDSVAESSGLKDDLKGTFGDRWIWILALAMAQAIRPTVMRGSMDTVNRTCITDILDLEYPSDGRIPISCSTTHAELTTHPGISAQAPSRCCACTCRIAPHRISVPTGTMKRPCGAQTNTMH